MSQQQTQFETLYTARINHLALLVLTAHIPVVTVLSWLHGQGTWLPLLLGLLVIAGPAILIGRNRRADQAPALVGVASMGISALAIYSTQGRIETHFHVFIMLSALIVYGRMAPIVAATLTIAAHHLLFWLWVPSGVYNYSASLTTVLLHAFYVAMEAIPACWIAREFGRTVWARGMVGEQLMATSERVTAEAQQISQASLALAQSAAEQARTLDESAAASASAGELATINSRASHDALQSLHSLHKDVSLAGLTLDDVRDKVGLVARSSREIRQIVNLVQEISFRTNILALNASVEAARAGSAGQSFAVVANEFHDLARRSSMAAREIAGLIERTAAQADEGQTSVQELVLAMQKAIESTAQARSHMDSVQETSANQTRVLGQVQRELSGLSKISNGTVILMESTVSSTNQLTEHAVSLQEMVASLDQQ